MSTKARIKQILNDCCAGNASLATDILHTEFVIIDRGDLPDVKHGIQEDMYYADGQNIIYTSLENARTWVLRDVAVWQFMEHAGERAAEKLRARLDELAAEFTAVNSYSGQMPYTQKLIDRIIELEGQS